MFHDKQNEDNFDEIPSLKPKIHILTKQRLSGPLKPTPP